MVVCGDFNIDMLDPTKANSKVFKDFVTSHSLIQPISVHTRYSDTSASLLDLFLITHDVSIFNSCVLDAAFSDHLPILLYINSSVSRSQPTLITRRSFKHFNKSWFEEDLSAAPWSILDVFDDPDDKVEAFNCIVLYCIVLYCIVLYCIVLYCIVLYCIVLLYWYST